MTKTAGPMVSSSIAERIPPWTKPAGLRNSSLPSKPILIHPSLGLASSRRQPSSLDDGGAVRSSSAVLIMGKPPFASFPTARLLTAWCQELEAEPVRDHLAHQI